MFFDMVAIQDRAGQVVVVKQTTLDAKISSIVECRPKVSLVMPSCGTLMEQLHVEAIPRALLMSVRVCLVLGNSVLMQKTKVGLLLISNQSLMTCREHITASR